MLPPFETFVDDHRTDVWRFLVASVGPAEAEDCFQETFLAALRAYPRLNGANNLRSWVLTIAHRKAIDAHRGASRRPRPVDGVPEHPSAATDVTDDDLWRAVRALPPKQRAAVVYRYVNDLPYAQIARIMSCSVEAARRSAHEGIRKLKEVHLS